MVVSPSNECMDRTILVPATPPPPNNRSAFIAYPHLPPLQQKRLPLRTPFFAPWGHSNLVYCKPSRKQT